MAHNFPVPDEARLERLIGSVYERMPVAEMTRLNRIEERLARRLPAGKSERRVNTLPWWIVLLLAGGFATAAWWAGERFFEHTTIERETPEYGEELLPPVAPSGQEAEEAIQSEESADKFGEKDSPMIYQREAY